MTKPYCVWKLVTQQTLCTCPSGYASCEVCIEEVCLYLLCYGVQWHHTVTGISIHLVLLASAHCCPSAYVQHPGLVHQEVEGPL
jgi:hypothetical protein